MSPQTAPRGPCFRALTVAAWLVVGPLAATLLAQPTTSDAVVPPQVAEENTTYTGYFTEPRFMSRSISKASDFLRDGTSAPGDGFFVETSNMVTGAGWITAGPGYRHRYLDRQILFETSAAVSWRFYKMAQARLEFPRLANGRVAAGTQAMWRDLTQVQYFGVGPDRDESLRSQYRLRTGNIVGYARYFPKRWLAISGELGWLRRPALDETTGSFKRDLPETAVVFPNDPAVGLEVQPDFLHGGLAVAADSRDRRGHPTRGGVYRAAWSTFRDQADGRFSFHRYEAEAAQFMPLAGPRWVLAFHGWTVATDIDPAREVPIYLMPSLGGANTIRAYSDYRFHDRNLAVVNVESRWALFTHVDVAAFFDAGNVARRAADLNFDKTAYGIGVRLHTQRTTIGRLDIARGNGGWNIVFRTSEPLQLKRITRRVAAIPFVP